MPTMGAPAGAGAGGWGQPGGPPPSGPKRSGPSPLLIIGLVVVLIAVVVGGIVIAGGGDDDEDTTTAIAEKPAAALSTKDVIAKGTPGTVSLTGRQGDDVVGGTGVIYDKAQGLILTNAHVVQGVSALKARLHDGTEINVQIRGTAPCDDLAVVKLTTVPPTLTALTLGDSAKVANGDNVVSLGFPSSFEDPATQKVVSTTGIVQSPNVAAQVGLSSPKFPSTIQHSATVNPGNSGGPLLNDKSEVVGVNTLTNPKAQGQFYAIAMNTVKPQLADLAAGKSRADAGWDLGSFDEYYVKDVFDETGYGTEEQAKEAEDWLEGEPRTRGLLVFGVSAASPAEGAKIEGGDFIHKLNGTVVGSVQEVCDVLATAPPGRPIVVEGFYLTEAGDHEAFDAWKTELKLL